MDYRLARFTLDRLPEVLELERALWTQDEDANAAYFAWKYEQNPVLPEPHLFLALSGDRVIGVRGFHGTAWSMGEGGPPVVTPTGGDTVVAPEHRGRRVFERINQYALSELGSEGFRMVCNFSAGPATFLLSLRGGWRAVGPYAPLVRESVSPRRPQFEPAGVAVRLESEPRAGPMADLVERAPQEAAGRSIGLHRDRRFFEWRFKNPISRYHFLYAEGGADGGLRGYLVLQERVLKPQRGMRIVDWEATDADTFSALLAAAIHSVETERLTLWSATLPAWVRTVMTEAGFEPHDDTRGSRHYRPGPLVAALGPAADLPNWELGGLDPTDMGNWSLRMACSDSC